MVFEGFDRLSEEPIAVKISKRGYDSEKEIQRNTREVGILSIMAHDNVIQLISTLQIPGFAVPGLVFERMVHDLDFEIYEQGLMEKTRIFEVMIMIFSALDYIHHLNIVHRDIKPPNILVHRSGQIKVTDFGISTRIDLGKTMKKAVGSKIYLAPEVLIGEYREEVDIWVFILPSFIS